MPGPFPSHPPIVQPLGSVATEHLDLRPFVAEDLVELAQVFAKSEVWRFPYGRGFTRNDTARFLEMQIQECSLPPADNFASVRVAERLGMRLEREVEIPANERRGALTARLFMIKAAEWRGPSTGVVG